MKSCYVVYEDISSPFDVENHKTLELCPGNIPVTSSCLNNEKNHLERIEVMQPKTMSVDPSNNDQLRPQLINSLLYTANLSLTTQ